MIRGERLVVAVMILGAVTGCSRLGLSDGPSRSPQPMTYEPLPAAPTAPVTQGALQPLPPVPGAPVDPAAPTGARRDTAAVGPSAGAGRGAKLADCAIGQ